MRMAESRPMPDTQPVQAPPQVVPLGRQHLAGFHRAVDRVAREGRYLAMLEAPPFARTRRLVLDSLKDGGVHLVALVDDEVVGWCDLRLKTTVTQRHCAVLGMGIVAEHRHRGLGRRLLLETLARARGLRRIELVVRADNSAAIALYRSCGFEVEGTCRSYLRHDGVEHDALLMARLEPLAGA
jgi:ribosomal protein S18 acetylase RimI-like enzyme